MGGTPIRSEVGTYIPKLFQLPICTIKRVTRFRLLASAASVPTNCNITECCQTGDYLSSSTSLFRRPAITRGFNPLLVGRSGFLVRSVGCPREHLPQSNCCTHRLLACLLWRSLFGTPKNQVLSILGKPSWKWRGGRRRTTRGT